VAAADAARNRVEARTEVFILTIQKEKDIISRRLIRQIVAERGQ
jgi:hypothetical protein